MHLFRQKRTFLHSVVSITGAFRASLGGILLPPLHISFALNRKEVGSALSVSCTIGRPDETIYEQNFLMAVGEHKASY